MEQNHAGGRLLCEWILGRIDHEVLWVIHEYINNTECIANAMDNLMLHSSPDSKKAEDEYSKIKFKSKHFN